MSSQRNSEVHSENGSARDTVSTTVTGQCGAPNNVDRPIQMRVPRSKPSTGLSLHSSTDPASDGNSTTGGPFDRLRGRSSSFPTCPKLWRSSDRASAPYTAQLVATGKEWIMTSPVKE